MATTYTSGDMRQVLDSLYLVSQPRRWLEHSPGNDENVCSRCPYLEEHRRRSEAEPRSEINGPAME